MTREGIKSIRTAMKVGREERPTQIIRISNITLGELTDALRNIGGDMNFGVYEMFDWLRNNGYLYDASHRFYNLPTEFSMSTGLLEIHEDIDYNEDGSLGIKRTIWVTSSGQEKIMQHYITGSHD